MFIFAAIATLLAFLVRLGVRPLSIRSLVVLLIRVPPCPKIPEQSLDSSPSADSDEPLSSEDEDNEVSQAPSIRTAAANGPALDLLPPSTLPVSPRRIRPRTLSTYESDDGHDPEPRSVGSRRAVSRQSSSAVGSWSTGANVREEGQRDSVA